MLAQYTGGDLASDLNDARRRAVEAAAAGTDAGADAGLTDETPCRVLGELLGLDAAWVVAGSGSRRPVTASWVREGARPHELGAARLAAITAEYGGRPGQTRDGDHALLVVPLRAAGRRLGDLVGSVRSARAFSRDELRAAELVAAGAVSLGRDGEEGYPAGADERLLAHIGLLQTLTDRLAQARSEHEIAQAVALELGRVIGCETCRFCLPSPSGEEVVPLAIGGDEPDDEALPALVSRVGEGIVGQAMLDGTARLIPDVAVDPHATEAEAAGDFGESMIVAPMLEDGDPVGVIILSARGIGAYDATDLQLLEVVAAHAGVACRNVRLYVSMREAAEISEALLELGAALATQNTVRGVADMLARAVDRLVDCAAMSVWLRDGERMHLATHVGYTPDEAARLGSPPLRADAPPFQDHLGARRLSVLASSDAAVLHERLPLTPLGSSFAVIPIGERAGNRGAMILQRGRRRGRPSAGDEQMLLGIADQALLSIDNRALLEELEDSFVATMQALANALETKDEYTGDHAQALVGMAEEVGRRLDMPASALRDVGVAAALHDVGKIGIPAVILQKAGPLTDDEWAIMRRHPELGARIMEPVTALAGARSLVLACHEHWDGTGYPRGLAGEEIPLGARIILAVDAFHAMTSDRVYRPAVPLEDAVEELRRCRGTHFEPRVVDALIEVVQIGSTT